MGVGRTYARTYATHTQVRHGPADREESIRNGRRGESRGVCGADCLVFRLR